MSATQTKEVKALIECPLCLSTFQQPKCLPCVHSFCQDCLQRYVDEDDTGDELPCPECRQMFRVPPQGVSGLPNNFFMVRMIELERNYETEAEKRKIGDTSNDGLAEGTDRGPAALKSMEEGLKAVKNYVRMCEAHRSEPLRAYCRKCKVCICMSCVLGDHNEHKYEKIEVAARRISSQFSDNLTKLSEAVTHGQSSVKDIKTAEEQVIKESSVNEQKIRERCDEIRKVLAGLEVELLSEVIAFRELIVKEIRSKIYQVEFQNAQLESFILYLRELREKGSDCDIASSAKDVSTRAEQLLMLSRDTQAEEPNKIHMGFLSYCEELKLDLGRRLIEELTTVAGSGKLAICDGESQTGGGLLVDGEKWLVIVGLDIGLSTEQKICHISLDKPDVVKVINSTPAYVWRESAACMVSNDLYAVGIGRAYNELWKWSASTDEWTRCADLPSGRRRHCVTAVENKIYMLGGWVDADKRTLDSILYYDINSDTWIKAGKLPQAVHSATCLTYKKCVYVFDGLETDGRPFTYIQIFDTSTGGVSLGSNPMPHELCLMRAVLWRSKALLVGQDICYVYDLESNTWQEREKFKTGVMYFGLTLNDNTLYISGGCSWSFKVNSYIDDVKSLSVDDFISDNQEAEWRHHATLPKPALVHM